MSKENDNNFDQFNDHDDEMSEKSSPKASKPWNSRFSENETIRNRQYSRSARNQPVKEASSISKMLLIIIALIVVIPFVLFGIIQAGKGSDEITSRTTNEIMISRNENKSTTSESTTQDESKTSTTTQAETTANVSSQEIVETTVAPTQAPVPEQTPAPTPAPAPAPSNGTVHTISSGESWWSIARTYGVDPYELAAYNGMTIETAIYPGLQILIP